MFLGMTQAEFYKALETGVALVLFFGAFIVAAGLWPRNATNTEEVK